MQSWTYLTTVIDLFDPKVIGWHMRNNMRASDTVIPGLNKACAGTLRCPNQDFLFRGIHYPCNEFI